MVKLSADDEAELVDAVTQLDEDRDRYDPFHPRLTLSTSLAAKVDPGVTRNSWNGAVTVSPADDPVFRGLTVFDILYGLGKARARWLRWFAPVVLCRGLGDLD